MERFVFDEHMRKVLENSVVPIGIYQMVDGHVVTLIATDGLVELFGYKSRKEAFEKMDNDMYWNVHPDDVGSVLKAAEEFIKEDKTYNLVCRIKKDIGYRLIHTRGKHVTTESGARLAVVWYIDEGEVVLDANRAMVEQTIEELRTSMQSLLNNMPALSFSKDVKTGVYLACNQAFAAYANKKTPAEVAGLRDDEIFDPVTAAHFVEDDRQALSMDVPYVFFEDAPDAAGNPRQFQTTKLKFVDDTGRLCLLGMSMDVTEVMRVRKENEEAKAAYREALNTSATYESIVEALAVDYFNFYYVDIETDEYVEYGSQFENGKKKV
ncbi:MAG: PAS domain-containing protein, partial [Lachnospiraceae bacterium]|nr:PAS domain-containing protein [Lachnospiraceae bacterium]